MEKKNNIKKSTWLAQFSPCMEKEIKTFCNCMDPPPPKNRCNIIMLRASCRLRKTNSATGDVVSLS